MKEVSKRNTLVNLTLPSSLGSRAALNASRAADALVCTPVAADGEEEHATTARPACRAPVEVCANIGRTLPQGDV